MTLSMLLSVSLDRSVFSETSLLGDCGILVRGKAGTVIPFDGSISSMPLAEMNFCEEEMPSKMIRRRDFDFDGQICSGKREPSDVAGRHREKMNANTINSNLKFGEETSALHVDFKKLRH